MSESSKTEMLPDEDATRVTLVVAEYDDGDKFLHAVETVRDAKPSKPWDTHVPYPIHGLDDAMGLKPTILPWIVFFAGLTGLIIAVLGQAWANGSGIEILPGLPGYQMIISGKPYWALPANIPIAFEVTVLFAALTTFALTFVLNNLPAFYHPLFRLKAFKKATDDRFFISIEDGSDEGVRKLLEGTGPIAMHEVSEPVRPPRFPRVLTFVGAGVLVFALVPPIMIAKARQTKGEQPRLHTVFDMDFQTKYKAQAQNDFFLPGDGRSMRPHVEGTIARGDLRLDRFYFEGLQSDDAYADGFPIEQLREEFYRAASPTSKADGARGEQGSYGEGDEAFRAALLARGQERFNVYCATCHGYGGNGGGSVALRAEQLAEGTWVAPASYHSDYLRNVPNGYLYNVITKGVRKMRGYGHAIPVEDRWAIVAYIRSLQRHKLANYEAVPENKRNDLR